MPTVKVELYRDEKFQALIFLARMVTYFPGLVDGETNVDGAELTAWITSHITDRANEKLRPYLEGNLTSR